VRRIGTITGKGAQRRFTSRFHLKDSQNKGAEEEKLPLFRNRHCISGCEEGTFPLFRRLEADLPYLTQLAEIVFPVCRLFQSVTRLSGSFTSVSLHIGESDGYKQENALLQKTLKRIVSPPLPNGAETDRQPFNFLFFRSAAARKKNLFSHSNNC
jgi:hypothetical protein